MFMTLEQDTIAIQRIHTPPNNRKIMVECLTQLPGATLTIEKPKKS